MIKRILYGVLALTFLFAGVANATLNGRHNHDETLTYCTAQLDQDAGLKAQVQNKINYFNAWSLVSLSPTTGACSLANVVFQDGYYGNTTWQARNNFNTTSGHWSQTIIQFNLTHMANDSDYFHRVTACNELGHAFGLAHGASEQDCMEAGFGSDYTEFISSTNKTVSNSLFAGPH